MPVKDRSAVVAAAAAKDLNDELTIAVNAVAEALKGMPVGPGFRALLDLNAALQRCVWKTTNLANYAARQHVAPSTLRLEEAIGAR